MIRRALSPTGLSGLLALSVVLLVACIPDVAPAPTVEPSPPPVEPAPTAAAATPPPAPTPTPMPDPTPQPQPTPAETPAAEPEGLTGAVKIVSALPRQGASRAQTDAIVNAIRMAIQDVDGRVGEATVDYEDLDDATAARGAWDAGRVTNNANRLIADSDVLLYIGTYNSGAAKVAIPILNRAGPLAMISPANSYPGLTRTAEGMTEPNEPEVYYPTGARNYFRVAPTDEFQGVSGAVWASELGAGSVYVLDDTEPYGHGLARAFHSEARRLGLNIVGGPEGIDPMAVDYAVLAEKIESTNPDLVYFGGIAQNNAGRLWQDLRSAMPHVMLMGGDGVFDDHFVGAAGTAAEETYLTLGGAPPENLTGAGDEFVSRYTDRYQQAPEFYAAYGYEAAMVGLTAIEDCGRKDRACVVEALGRIRDYDGVLGTWSFLDSGDISRATMSGYVVRNGTFEFERLLEASR